MILSSTFLNNSLLLPNSKWSIGEFVVESIFEGYINVESNSAARQKSLISRKSKPGDSRKGKKKNISRDTEKLKHTIHNKLHDNNWSENKWREKKYVVNRQIL